MIHLAHAPSGAQGVPGNVLLAALGAGELRLLEPIEHVRLRPRSVLLEPGMPIRHLYFPAGAVVSVVHTDPRGMMPELAQVGMKGMIDVAALLGGERARYRCVVQSAGGAYRVPVASALAAFAHGKVFQATVLQWADTMIHQLSQNVLCKMSHSVEQQLCRRLLHYADGAGAETFELTHEQIAEALGARRQSITEAARKLQLQQAISYSRGRVALLDRSVLERHACACYGILRDARQ